VAIWDVTRAAENVVGQTNFYNSIKNTLESARLNPRLLTCPAYKTPDPSVPPPPAGRCGANFGSCPSKDCCSQWGYCGNGSGYCGTGCQPAFGKCQAA
jgi:hypothetical protein